MVKVFCGQESSSKDTFTFKFSAGPALKFSFDSSISVPVPSHQPFKRRRALSDVDGDGNQGRKKRRLRLHLVTSRLSRPFSQPASNIVNRGFANIPIWGAKNKAHSKNFLRRAAIMNRVRLRMDAAKDFLRQEQERRKERISLREIILPKPRFVDLPLPLSPLGLSNYDALDLDDVPNFDDEQEEVSDGISVIYSDFNIMNPSTGEGDGDGYEYLDALDGIVKEDLPDAPPTPPPEDSVVEMLKEEETHRGDGYFVQITG
jgi:hypothetical protein